MGPKSEFMYSLHQKAKGPCFLLLLCKFIWFLTEKPEKDKIIQRVSKMEEIPIEKKKLVEINKNGHRNMY
jgi:hypothetical protein